MAPTVRLATGARPARPRRGTRRRPAPGRGGLRGGSGGAPAARRPAAAQRARTARPACHPAAHPDRRGRGRIADRAGRLRRPPGDRARRRAPPVRHARRRPGACRRIEVSHPSSSSSTRWRIRRTSARCCAAPRRPVSTASSSRPGARRRSARPRSRRRPERSSTSCCARSTTSPGRSPTSTSAGSGSLGSEADAPLTARQTDLRGPLAIVVGQRGSGPRAGRPAAVRHVHAHPDAGSHRVAQCRRRRIGPAVRGGGAARPGRTRPHAVICRCTSRWRRRGPGDGPCGPPPSASTSSRLPNTGGEPEADLLPGEPPTPKPSKARKPRAPRTPPRLTHLTARPYHSPAPMGSSAVRPCASRRRSSIGRAAVL